MAILSTKIDLRDVISLNKYSLCTVQPGLFPIGNKRATASLPKNSRSESCIVVNPRNKNNLIGASKKFIEPSDYLFKLGPIYSFDGGVSWAESELKMLPGWDGMTDPAVAFDDFGNAFLVGEPLRFNREHVHTSQDLTGLGMVVYRSQDGGVTWNDPIQLTTTTSDDKQWIVCDNNRYSPHYGNVYVAWAASSPLRFARSTDYGASWKGKEGELPGSLLVEFSAFAPEMSVSADGTLHVLWHMDGSGTIQYLRSKDGGNTFEQVRTIVTGVISLRGHLQETDDWPHFEHAKFRVITLVTDCVVGTDPSLNGTVVVAWADMREGRSRIYYRRSIDNGQTWLGPDSGAPLLPQVTFGDAHCFHPQIIATGTGVVGCAYYLFGLEAQHYLVRVQLAASWDDGASFPYFITVTDRSWDPSVNAPLAHGNGNVDFIGEYFGLDASDESFYLLWTDTRTGVQELYFDEVRTKKVVCPHIPDLVGEVLVGVTNDGGGLIIVGNKIIKVPPHSPLLDVLAALGSYETASQLSREERTDIQLAALRAASKMLDRGIADLSGKKQIKTSKGGKRSR